eukprot:1156908-Pelagomonas_calceolata.AAC.4
MGRHILATTAGQNRNAPLQQKRAHTCHCSKGEGLTFVNDDNGCNGSSGGSGRQLPPSSKDSPPSCMTCGCCLPASIAPRCSSGSGTQPSPLPPEALGAPACNPPRTSPCNPTCPSSCTTRSPSCTSRPPVADSCKPWASLLSHQGVQGWTKWASRPAASCRWKARRSEGLSSCSRSAWLRSPPPSSACEGRRCAWQSAWNGLKQGSNQWPRVSETGRRGGKAEQLR